MGPSEGVCLIVGEAALGDEPARLSLLFDGTVEGATDDDVPTSLPASLASSCVFVMGLADLSLAMFGMGIMEGCVR